VNLILFCPFARALSAASNSYSVIHVLCALRVQIFIYPAFVAAVSCLDHHLSSSVSHVLQTAGHANTAHHSPAKQCLNRTGRSHSKYSNLRLKKYSNPLVAKGSSWSLGCIVAVASTLRMNHLRAVHVLIPQCPLCATCCAKLNFSRDVDVYCHWPTASGLVLAYHA
jgi:hypothetical protein